MLKSKKQTLVDFLTLNDLLQCPICGKSFLVDQNQAKCESHHTFDISKNGYMTLLKARKLNIDKHYDKFLFDNRRNLIASGFFEPVENFIVHFINSNSIGVDKINILDLGSGEGTITKRIYNKLDLDSNIVMLDYSKTAIKLSTDYIKDNVCSIVADMSFLPIKSDSIEYIINFLSPITPVEAIRVLNSKGFIIKVIPTINYLKELRDIIKKEYTPKVESNLLKTFNIYDSKTISYSVKLTKETKEYLKNMTPLMFDCRDDDINLESVTVELKVLILKPLCEKVV